MSDRPSHDTMSRAHWERTVLEPARARTPERTAAFRTASGRDVAPVYTQEDIADFGDGSRGGGGVYVSLGDDVHAGSASGGEWTIRQAAGFDTPASTNIRLKQLLAAGAGALEIVCDRPTRRGLDPDDLRAAGDGRRGDVPIATTGDLRVLLDGVVPGEVPVVLSAGASTPMVFATYLAAVEGMGASWATVKGVLAHDILQAGMTGGPLLFPPNQSMRLATDVVAFAHRSVPGWRGLEISGVLMRDAGASAEEELTFTMANAVAFVAACIDAGIGVDALASRLSFAFGIGGDVFEEIAKLRAARRVWAHLLRERFGARAPGIDAMHVHARTLGAALPTAEPINDVVRTTYQALAAVLGGTNSLQTNGEGSLGVVPGFDSGVLTVRMQQILRHEVGLDPAADLLGGSWWLDRLTRDMVDGTLAGIEEIDRLGGMPAAIDAGVPQRRIAATAAARGRARRVGESTIVGGPVGGPTVVTDVAARTVEPVVGTAPRRDVAAGGGARGADDLQRALDRLAHAALQGTDLTSSLVSCARTGATTGEMVRALQAVWGEYRAAAIE